MIVEPTADCMENVNECNSGEEWLHRVDLYNKQVRKIWEELRKELGDKMVFDEEVMLLAFDVEKMFPSLIPEDVARSVREEMLRSPLKYAGINAKEVARYLAMTLTNQTIKEEKIGNLLQKREHNKGPKPGVTGNSAK